MKIMFYINAIHHGGAERVMCNLATQFSERGYDCVLLTSFRDSWEYGHGARVRRKTLFESKPKGNFIARNLSLTRALRQELKREKPDVLVSFMAEPNFRAIIASMGLKNKVVISVRNDPNREYSNLFTRVLAKTLFRLADGVVFQTEDAKKWFPKSIQKKSKIIFNQVDEVFYNTKYEGERHDVVTTGRLVPQKNHKLLICAFADIADQVPDNLIIYGEGELRSELEALIAELHMENRIFLPGGIKNVADTIKSAKLFVLSSDYEGMPNSLMEAMALGIPCISTDCPCGGPRMLLCENAEYCLTRINDCKQLSIKIYKLLTDLEQLAFNQKYMQQRALLFLPGEVYRIWELYVNKIIKKCKESDF